MAYADTIRGASEAKQLKNLMDHVGAKTTELITLVSATNATTETYLQMSTAIGNKQYWLQLRNDSSEAWLEGGLGDAPVEGAELRVYLPKEVMATGHYLSGYGAAHLVCTINAGVPHITLTSSGEGL
jgi:hypothetical protein